MGPKRKGKTGKTGVKTPKDDPEYVTALMKQMFEIQMVDIEKKIDRLHTRQEELKETTEKLEQLIADYQKEQGTLIEELKEKMELKYEERSNKRDQVSFLQQSLVDNRKKYQNEIMERQKKYDEMIEELTEKVEKMEEEHKILEDFKANKAEYLIGIEEEEREKEEAERQHQRNLFALLQKLDKAKIRLKKDAESRLLLLSFEFQETSQTKIGTPIHRMMQENTAIEHELGYMKKSTSQYKLGYELSQSTINLIRQRERMMIKEKDKFIAKCVVQLNIIKVLNEKKKYLEQYLKKNLPLEEEYERLDKRHKLQELYVEKKKLELTELNKTLLLKQEEAGRMSEVSAFVRKTIRKLQILVKSALRTAEEALAIQVIPMGETEEEKYLSMETKLKLYQKRRNTVFKKRGKLLKNLQEIMLRAQMTEEEWQILSIESFNYDQFDFKGLFSPSIQHEIPREESTMHPMKESKASVIISGSDISLPRSVEMEVKIMKKIDEEEEEEEGEMEEDERSKKSLVEIASRTEEDEEEWGGEDMILSIQTDLEKPKEEI